MTPFRVTAPVAPVVGIIDLKAHLRVDYSDDDILIQALQDAAVSYLDGWRGILGRCIMRQQWAMTCGQAGTFRLPFPDVVEASVSSGDVTLSRDDLGAIATTTEPATVTMTLEAPADILAAVVLIVKMLVAHWYHNREAVGVNQSEMPLAVQALIEPIRWARL